MNIVSISDFCSCNYPENSATLHCLFLDVYVLSYYVLKVNPSLSWCEGTPVIIYRALTTIDQYYRVTSASEYAKTLL